MADARRLLPAVAGHRPDLVVVDIRMPPSFTDEGARAASEIKATHPEVGVLVLSQHIETAHAVELVSRGGFGYLLKDRVLDVEEFLGRGTGRRRRVGARPAGRGEPALPAGGGRSPSSPSASARCSSLWQRASRTAASQAPLSERTHRRSPRAPPAHEARPSRGRGRPPPGPRRARAPPLDARSVLALSETGTGPDAYGGRRGNTWACFCSRTPCEAVAIEGRRRTLLSAARRGSAKATFFGPIPAEMRGNWQKKRATDTGLHRHETPANKQSQG